MTYTHIWEMAFVCSRLFNEFSSPASGKVDLFNITIKTRSFCNLIKKFQAFFELVTKL